MPSQRYTGPETKQELKGSQGLGSHFPHTCPPPPCRRNAGPRKCARDRESSQPRLKPRLGPKETGWASDTLLWTPESHDA